MRQFFWQYLNKKIFVKSLKIQSLTLIFEKLVNQRDEACHAPQLTMGRCARDATDARVHAILIVACVAIDELINGIGALFQRQANADVGVEGT